MTNQVKLQSLHSAGRGHHAVCLYSMKMKVVQSEVIPKVVETLVILKVVSQFGYGNVYIHPTTNNVRHFGHIQQAFKLPVLIKQASTVASATNIFILTPIHICFHVLSTDFCSTSVPDRCMVTFSFPV